MASENPINTVTFISLFFLLFSIFTGCLSLPGSETQVTQLTVKRMQLLTRQELNKEDSWRRAVGSRRMVIGYRAPVCTYNDCTGCRFKCTSEQVPVDANDPMNSAYHYRCVCHR